MDGRNYSCEQSAESSRLPEHQQALCLFRQLYGCALANPKAAAIDVEVAGDELIIQLLSVGLHKQLPQEVCCRT